MLRCSRTCSVMMVRTSPKSRPPLWKRGLLIASCNDPAGAPRDPRRGDKRPACSVLQESRQYGQMREGATPAVNAVNLLLRTQVRLLDDRFLLAAKRQSCA